MKTYAIILAGGRGNRMQSDTPKQYLDLCGKPLLFYPIKTFSDWGVDEIILVCGSGDEEFCKKTFIEQYGFSKITHIVPGGKERYHSVYQGLSVIEDPDGIVMIHDGARAFVTKEVIEACYQDACQYASGVAAVPAKDTIKVADVDGMVVDTPKRSSLYQVQTPQTFPVNRIKAAYETCILKESELEKQGVQITDDSMIAEYFTKQPVKLSKGDYSNIKVTTPEDLLFGKLLVEK